MLRIWSVEPPEGTVILRLEGRLIGPWVEELRRSCDRVLPAGVKLTLDFSEVSFVDRNGIELIRTLGKRNVALLNCSPFVAEQLKA